MFPNLANNPAFNLASLTGAINILPNKYGRLNQMNLFPVKGVKTRTVYVEEKNGVLNILQTQPVGAPGQANKRGKRKVRSFVVPHIPLDDIVLPADVEGVRAFGTEDQFQPIIAEVNDRLQGMKDKHDITLEHLRMGALKGIILDADATTLYNLYTEFGINQKTVDFVFGTATTDIRKKCAEVVRHIEDNLLGEVMTGVRALVSQEFFDKLVGHAKVQDAYKYHQQASDRLGGDMRKNFQFGGITFEEYRGTGTDADGNARRFITAEDGHAFPEGTLDTFKTAAAPADFNETVNTVGLIYYAKMAQRKMERGYDLHTQSNPLPLCQRPGVLVRIFSST
jgi:hypothetical protein